VANAQDLAYAAGIIDGEGYIGISTTPGKRSTGFKAMVAVGMCDPEVVVWLAETFGGSVYCYAPRGTAKRGTHRWQVTGETAAVFCRLVRPYLRLKHRQAELLVRYREDQRLDHTRRGGPGGQTPADEVVVKHRYAGDIRALNQREAVV